MDKKLQKRIQNLLALSESGVGGEKENAKARLDALCTKHNVAIEDFLDTTETTELYWIRYNDTPDKTLLCQVGYMVSPKCTQWVNKSKQRQIGFEITKSEHAEMILRFTILRRELKILLERTVRAFIQSNHIFPDKGDVDTSESKKLTQAEMDEIDAMLKLARGINPTPIHQGIEDKS